MTETIEERLAYIEKCYNHDMTHGNDFPVSLKFTDWKWLIKQAERVHELEEDLRLSEQEESRRHEELKRYREAIKRMKTVPRSTNSDWEYIQHIKTIIEELGY